MKKRHISHGEVNMFEYNGELKGLSKYEPKKDELINGQFKLADSETTGNHHLLKLADGVEMYEDDKGTLYIRNYNDTEISCVDTKRHDVVTLPKGTWVKKPSQEVNHLLNIKREVRD